VYVRWMQVVLILPVGGSANNSRSAVKSNHHHEKCMSGRATRNLCYDWTASRRVGTSPVRIEPLQSDNTSTTTGNCVRTQNPQQTRNPINLAERNDLGKYQKTGCFHII
jgi:hypothetical protein